MGGGWGGGDVHDEANDRVSSDETVRRNELSVADVAVGGSRSISSCVVGTLVAIAAAERLPFPKSNSHRRSCRPVLIGNFPFDLIDKLNDRPGDRLAAGIVPLGFIPVDGVKGGGREGPAVDDMADTVRLEILGRSYKVRALIDHQQYFISLSCYM